MADSTKTRKRNQKAVIITDFTTEFVDAPEGWEKQFDEGLRIYLRWLLRLRKANASKAEPSDTNLSELGLESSLTVSPSDALILPSIGQGG